MTNPERAWTAVTSPGGSRLRILDENGQYIVMVYASLRKKQIADRIVHAVNCHDELVEALEWYAEQARLARLIHSEGDKGRHALADDGGNRARNALSKASGTEMKDD